jgi:hypothetical protein
VRPKFQEILNIFIEISSTAVRDVVGYVCDWSRHKWQSPLGVLDSAGFDRESCDELNLEVVKVLIQALKLPMPAILHLTFNNKPENIICETIPRNTCFYRSKEP